VPDTALRLGTWLGNGPKLWLNLQQAYDLWHARTRLGAALGKKPCPHCGVVPAPVT
jgi:addiction module HigA family antidote